MLYTLRFFSLQNAVCFIMLTCLVPVLFIFYIQGVLKLKKNNSGAKGLRRSSPASFRETLQWLKFPLNGLRGQSRVSTVVGLLTLVDL